MGELSFLTEKLISVFMHKLFEGASLVASFEEDFSFICEELVSIKCLFNDTEESRKHTTMSNWLDKLEDFLVDAVDVVKECSAASKWDLISHYFMGLKMKSLKERIIKIHQSGKYVKYLTGIADADRYNIEDRRGRSSALFGRDCDYKPVGLDKDIKAISALIKKEDGPRVIAVVGMGGLGKTLLVQHVFHALRNDKSTGFTRFVWLAVSKKFVVKELLLEIGRQTNLQTDQSNNLHLTAEELRCITYKHLEKQRCLFVLDDLWQEDTLEKIGLPLERGNKILLTSRHKSIAKITPDHYIHTTAITPSATENSSGLLKIYTMIANIIPDHYSHTTAITPSATENSSALLKIYTMTALDDGNSNKLFKRHAFPGDPEQYPLGFESVARGIVAKCGGLPLAVKTIAGYMATLKSVPNEWELTLRRLKELEAITHKVMPSLRLSYQGLPYHIKQCFMYCSVFPKNFEMESQHLLHAWIAEGFVSTQEAAEDPYDVARCYMDELVDRCLIEPSQVGGDGRGLRFRMHDLLHDLALTEFQKQCKCILRSEEEMEKLPECVGLRRISLINNNISKIEGAIPSPGLRTLFLSSNEKLDFISPDFFKKLEYLSVLDLRQTSIKSLPKCIESMKHLKFLNLSGTDIKMLPKSLSGLEHLQYLDVSNCAYLERLPAGIGKHKSMTYLNAEGCGMLTSFPVGMSELVHLRTLKGAVFQMEMPVNTRGLCSRIKRLIPAGHVSASQLRDLRGLVHLQHLSLVVHSPSADNIQLAGIFKDMTKMQTLSMENITFSPDVPGDSSSPDLPELPEEIKDMQHLEKVILRKWAVPRSIYQLQNLMELLLDGNQPRYDGLQRIPNLKKLQLFGDNKCIGFPEEFMGHNAFPKLEELDIQNFSRLRRFPSLHKEAMPILKRLQIESCGELNLERESDMAEELKRRRSQQGLQVLVDGNLVYGEVRSLARLHSAQ